MIQTTTSAGIAQNPLLCVALLEPRFMVEAKYPYSPYEIGDIIKLRENSMSVLLTVTKEWSEWSMENENVENYTNINSLKEYPALFKELEWWQNREINELPDYVKYQKLIYKVVDKFEASVRCEKHPFDGIGLDADLGSCLPATEKEYLSSLEQLGCANSNA